MAFSPQALLKEDAINFSTTVLRSSGAETSWPDWASDDGDGGPERQGREELRGITQPNSVENPRLGLGQHHAPPTRAVGSGRRLPRRPTSELNRSLAQPLEHDEDQLLDRPNYGRDRPTPVANQKQKCSSSSHTHTVTHLKSSHIHITQAEQRKVQASVEALGGEESKDEVYCVVLYHMHTDTDTEAPQQRIIEKERAVTQPTTIEPARAFSASAGAQQTSS